jgi:cytidine deaminase
LKFRDAIRAARRSDVYDHKTGAAVYDSRGKLLAIGWSHQRRDLKSTPYSMHAEHHALSRLKRSDQPRTIVIATVTKGGALTCSTPCRSCRNLINKYAITKVIAHEALQTTTTTTKE